MPAPSVPRAPGRCLDGRIVVTAPRRIDDSGRRRPYDSASLLDVAVRVFNTRGYDGTTMEHLSAAAGISKSSIYHHVSGKDDLLGRALDRALDGLFSVLADIEPGLGAYDRLALVLRRSVEVLMAELPYVTLLLRVRGNSRTERHALQRRREFDAQVTALVQAAVDEGSVTQEIDPALVTRLVFGLVNSVSEWYRPDRSRSDADIPTAVVTLVLHGIAVPDAGPRQTPRTRRES